MTRQIDFKPLEMGHIRALGALKIAPEQDSLVTANWITMAEAPFEPGSQIYGMWLDETPVGLIALIDPAVLKPGPDDIAPDAAYIWRLMVDGQHQGQGYGGQAMDFAVRISRDWGFCALTLGVADDPRSALPFYTRHGYRMTGRVIDTDLEMRRELGG